MSHIPNIIMQFIPLLNQTIFLNGFKHLWDYLLFDIKYDVVKLMPAGEIFALFRIKRTEA